MDDEIICGNVVARHINEIIDFVFGISKSGILEIVEETKTKPLVSIVCASHPSHIELQEKVRRMVAKQTYSPLELIIETGGRNCQEARNIGIRKSKGKYIAILDDDDSWHPTKIEKQVALMEENEDCGICITWAKDLRLIHKGVVMDFTPKKVVTYSDLLRGFAIAPTSTFFIRREAIEECGNFDEKMRFAHEYEFAIRLAKHGWKIMTVQEYLVDYGKFKNIERLSDNYVDYIKGHFDLINKYGIDMAKESIIFSLLRQTGVMFLFSIGLISRDMAHRLFYIFKRLETQGRL